MLLFISLLVTVGVIQAFDYGDLFVEDEVTPLTNSGFSIEGVSDKKGFIFGNKFMI